MKKLSKLYENLEFNEVRNKKNVQGQRMHKSGELAGQPKIPKFTYGKKPGNVTKKPDYWIKDGVDLIFPLDCMEIEAFMAENEPYLREIEALTGLQAQIWDCKKTVGPPRNKKFKTSYVRQRERPLAHKINRDLNYILYDEFDKDRPQGAQFMKELNERSLPPLYLSPNEETYKFHNRHLDDNTNDSIKFETSSFYSVDSAQEFLNMVFDRIEGIESQQIKTYHLGYQFNKKYNNWDPAKKSIKKYEGLTDIYGLERRGYTEPNLDVTMKSEFSVIGERNGDSFSWVVKMNSKFGRKDPEDFRIIRGLKDLPILARVTANGLLDDKSIVGHSTAHLSIEELEELQKNPNLPITNLVTVSEALRQAIHDFKSQLKSIDPDSIIEIAQYTAKDS